MAEPLGERIILRLSLKGHVIYCDNFFSSPALFQKLITKDRCVWHCEGKCLPTYMKLQTCEMKKRK
jgi:hypothetical protein